MKRCDEDDDDVNEGGTHFAISFKFWVNLQFGGIVRGNAKVFSHSKRRREKKTTIKTNSNRSDQATTKVTEMKEREREKM